MYNALALVNGNQALLTATILIQPPGSNEGANLLVANDTITLQRAGNSWLITSALHLVEKLEEAAGLEVLPPRSTQPIQEHTNEYELPDAESTQGGNDAQ